MDLPDGQRHGWAVPRAGRLIMRTPEYDGATTIRGHCPVLLFGCDSIVQWPHRTIATVFALSSANLRGDTTARAGVFPAIEIQPRAPFRGEPGLHGRWPSPLPWSVEQSERRLWLERLPTPVRSPNGCPAQTPGPLGVPDQHSHALGLWVVGRGRLRHPGRLAAQAQPTVRAAVRRLGLTQQLPHPAGGRAVQADLAVRPQDPGRRPERPPLLPDGYRVGLLAAHQRAVAGRPRAGSAIS
jgi:hypothetical protein